MLGLQIIPIVASIFFFKEFAGQAIAKAMLTTLMLTFGWMKSQTKKKKRPSPAKFLGKTWITEDGRIRLVFRRSTDKIALFGRAEGPLVIELDDEPVSSKNHFEGSIYCDDHGGSIGRVSLDLEPFNEIHVRTTSNVQANYKIDLVFRITWPLSPNII